MLFRTEEALRAELDYRREQLTNQLVRRRTHHPLLALIQLVRRHS